MHELRLIDLVILISNSNRQFSLIQQFSTGCHLHGLGNISHNSYEIQDGGAQESLKEEAAVDILWHPYTMASSGATVHSLEPLF